MKKCYTRKYASQEQKRHLEESGYKTQDKIIESLGSAEERELEKSRV